MVLAEKLLVSRNGAGVSTGRELTPARDEEQAPRVTPLSLLQFAQRSTL
jgi:hypothetical protein